MFVSLRQFINQKGMILVLFLAEVFPNLSHGTELTKFIISELLGTFVLVFFGNGAVACYELRLTKGSSKKQKGGLNWLGVGFGYGFGTMLGVIWSGFSDHHINPAATIFDFFLQIGGEKTIYEGQEWAVVVAILAQFVGAMLAQLILDAIFYISIHETEDGTATFAMHATAKPQTEKLASKWQYWIGFLTEMFGTLMLLLTLKSASLFGQNTLSFLPDKGGNTFIQSITAGFVVFLLVISIGGVTGPALNPARDLGPRIIYTILPLPHKEKKSAEWDYAWVPVAAPITGALIAAGIFLALNSLG